MKNVTTLAMATTLAVGTLAGCQTTPSVTAPTAQPLTVDALEAHNWQLARKWRKSNSAVYYAK